MTTRCEFQIVQAELTDLGPQALVHVIEPNGDRHIVRCLCRTGGVTEIGELDNSRTIEYLRDRYGRHITGELRSAVLRAVS